MSAEARRNGWTGFDIGDRVEGGWLYRCDGMPYPGGCSEQVMVSRRWSKVGKKKSGWLVCYGLEAKDGSKPYSDPDNLYEDHDIVLTFGPQCAPIVEAQDKARGVKR